LIYSILSDIARERGTKPGEEICKTFDINVRLDRMRSFFMVGAEPDCPDGGDFEVNTTLGPDGRPIPPRCTLGDQPECIEKGLHRFVPPPLEASAPVVKDASSP
jgi:hypothetical protein